MQYKVNNKIFKNSFILSLALLLISLTGCSGVSDYTIDLINGYYIAKTSAHNVKIYKKDTEDINGNAPTIPIYHEGKDKEFESESVTNVGQDQRYILAKTNVDKYYILDTEKDTILECLTSDEFNLEKKELGISYDDELKTIDEYKKSKK